ncbi:DinB family protein [Dawidia soli]|uniref:DinB family protein n=1 Tax=Dawidia soli TaxID=2782352 RepID=A0AAP2GGM4_9BACT|nr:DinB family protein [Dawidia soli]MBT1686286.1 DinB family protein [Dawidia soli]
MKIFKFVLVAVAAIAMSFDRPAATLTEAERKYALDLLQGTKEDLLKKVKGLTAEQLNFKADATSWSIAECVEHITLAESQLFEFAQSGLKEPADPSKRSEIKTKDEELVQMVADRSQKRQAQETMKPSGKFGSFEATLAEFKTQRDNHIKYIKTTSDDLRNHYNDFPFGKLDTYQTILLMAAHSRRHTAQVQEVLNNPTFPKKGK